MIGVDLIELGRHLLVAEPPEFRKPRGFLCFVTTKKETGAVTPVHLILLLTYPREEGGERE